MSIYTKNGDTGKSSTLDGKLQPKSSEIFDVLGELDELNAAIGLVKLTRSKDIQKILLEIQQDLFSVGAYFAGDDSSKRIDLFIKRTQDFEKIIDSYTKELPKQTQFILPGGSVPSAQIHFARTLCRRVERAIVELIYSDESFENETEILSYINRLSDLLYILARKVNSDLGVEDVVWEG